MESTISPSAVTGLMYSQTSSPSMVTSKICPSVSAQIRVFPFGNRCVLEPMWLKKFCPLLEAYIHTIWLDKFFEPQNVNEMSYDDLMALPNLSPVDAVAVLKMAELYIQHPTGDVPPDLWPAQLENKLTVRTPPPPQFNAGRGK